MKFYEVLILATIFAKNEGKTYKGYGTSPRNGLQNTVAELARLIHMVNEYGVKDRDEEGNNETFERNEGSSEHKPIDLDYYMGRNDNPQLMKTVMGLLQRNYNAHKAQERPSVRLQIISNPGVLEEYQSLLKRPLRSHPTSDENGNTRYHLEKNIIDHRRNAVFRLDTSSMENEEKTRSSEGIGIKKKPKLTDNDQSVYFNKKKSFDDDNKGDRIKFSGDIKNDDFNDKTRDIVDMYIDDVSEVKKKKGKEDDDLKQDNAWDVITKKYDWNERDTNSDETNKKQKKLKNDNRDEWNKEITKQDLDDWNKEIAKAKKSYDNRPRGDRKDKRKRDSGERNKSKMHDKSFKKKPSKNKDFEDYNRQKKEEKNREPDWDTTPYTLTTFRTTKMRKNELKDDKSFAPKIQSYYSKPRPKKHGNHDSNGFFGRTPIPYVGRQGIYVEK